LSRIARLVCGRCTVVPCSRGVRDHQSSHSDGQMQGLDTAEARVRACRSATLRLNSLANRSPRNHCKVTGILIDVSLNSQRWSVQRLRYSQHVLDRILQYNLLSTIFYLPISSSAIFFLEPIQIPHKIRYSRYPNNGTNSIVLKRLYCMHRGTSSGSNVSLPECDCAHDWVGVPVLQASTIITREQSIPMLRAARVL
jgi:hypothetical protein